MKLREAAVSLSDILPASFHSPYVETKEEPKRRKRKRKKKKKGEVKVIEETKDNCITCVQDKKTNMDVVVREEVQPVSFHARKTDVQQTVENNLFRKKKKKKKSTGDHGQRSSEERTNVLQTVEESSKEKMKTIVFKDGENGPCSE